MVFQHNHFANTLPEPKCRNSESFSIGHMNQVIQFKDDHFAEPIHEFKTKNSSLPVTINQVIHFKDDYFAEPILELRGRNSKSFSTSSIDKVICFKDDHFAEPIPENERNTLESSLSVSTQHLKEEAAESVPEHINTIEKSFPTVNTFDINEDCLNQDYLAGPVHEYKVGREEYHDSTSNSQPPRILSQQIIGVYKTIKKRRKKPNEHWKSIRASKQIIKGAILSEIQDENDKRPFAEIQINGVKVRGLLDSGASLSCFGMGAFETLRQCNIKWKEISNVIQTACGQKQEIKGFADIEIRFKNMSRKIRVTQAIFIFRNRFLACVRIVTDNRRNKNSRSR